MEPGRLPDDLSALEQALASRGRPGPSEALRRRVMAGVRAELQAPRRRLTTWEFALATAAAIVLWMNLSMIAASDTVPNLRPALGNGMETAVAAMCRLVPEMPLEEARRQVRLLRGGARLVPAPAPQPSPAAWWQEQARQPGLDDTEIR